MEHLRNSVMISALKATLLAAAVVGAAAPTYANPQGGRVTSGAASVRGEGTSNLTVYQATPRAVIDWQSFSIGAGESTTFIQPDSSSLILNRVIGIDPSQIFGNLSANGTVVLVNRNGILFGESARVDAAGLVATTHDISNEAFMAGDLLRFDRSGEGQASVVNKATITLHNAGLAAFVAPHVVNDGVITANYGRVSLGAGTSFTLDLYGDNLVSFAVGDAVAQTIVNADGTNAKALVENSGRITANEGRVHLTAEAARAVVNQSVNVSGIIEANSVFTQGGRIVLSGSGNVMTERTARLSADGADGGSISVRGDDVHLDGHLSADGTGQAAAALGPVQRRSGSLRRRFDVHADGVSSEAMPVSVAASGKGGTVSVVGGIFTSLDGTLSASGQTGGAVTVAAAHNFALNGRVLGTGIAGDGGSVSIAAGGETWEGAGSGIDVSGANGGKIRNITQGRFASSAFYNAMGTSGQGGDIDITGSRMLLLSSRYDASGHTAGGRVRIGGEYQGGKGLGSDELRNARELAANDGVSINVSVRGDHGDAGSAIIWSDDKTAFLGRVYATGGLLTGNGGFVEASSADTLIWRGTVETAINGARGGTLLLDPKNITIADRYFSQLSLILGFYAVGGDVDIGLDTGDFFGFEVSLDGNRLAVGAVLDDGATNSCNGCGAVYLFSFSDGAFSGGSLVSRIGYGYTGGSNIDLSGVLEANDNFGYAVSLSGNRLAVGTSFDDGAINACVDCGAVYLFNFADSVFSGGSLAARIGAGYNGLNDMDLAGLLDSGDAFGSGVSLDGTGLAVGAPGDDGAGNACAFLGCGAAYLFTFADTAFAGGALTSRIGYGYTGGNNINLAGLLDNTDSFGSSVSLTDTRLAVGAPGDRGASNACTDCGAVYVFTSVFSGGSLYARIGDGYTGGQNINLAALLDFGDSLGAAVALEGTRIAVGVAGDDGAGNTCVNCGAIFLYAFDDDFGNGSLAARIGDGYIGINDINLAGTLESNDYFGQAISLDGARLAAGDPFDDGATNACADCGAVYLFTFTDSAFAGGSLAAQIGSGYTGGGGTSLSGQLGPGDVSGNAVSLDGSRLAVGITGDDGAANSCFDCGAVYLFTFADSLFSGATLTARVGDGYTGGSNINLAGILGASDLFGSAVSLDGTRLAVGAPRDDGATNSCTDCGATYLFNFADTTFVGGILASRIGDGYTGANNVNLAGILGTLGNYTFDFFGTSVSLDGNRLAVGAIADEGATNGCSLYCGAVYLFTFSDSAFSGGNLAARIGAGYTGSNDINLDGTLGAFDFFGYGVSLDGTRLAVGAPGDSGSGNACIECGAVYLFSFVDSMFSGGALSARIGAGYSGGSNVNLAGILDPQDYFGISVSLDGERLAIGSERDDGATNSCADCGAVYFFSFNNAGLTGGALTSRMGDGYAGGDNVNLLGILETGDHFGSAVSIDGTRLAVGAPYDDGAANGCTNCGGVYLFTSPAGALPAALYGNNAASDVTITPDQLEAVLNTGTSVVLQASNDIRLLSGLLLDGTVGNLTLQAGRSVFINANIVTDANLTIIANDLLANGVIDAYRDPGAATIAMASGAYIDAGAGAVTIEMRNGAGKTNATGGIISLGGVAGSSVTVRNSSTSNGDIVINAGATLVGFGTGNAVTLAAGDQFINNAGAGAISTPGGRFLVYSQNWALDTRGGLSGANLYNRTFGANPPPSISQSGNLFIYALQPMLTVTANSTDRLFGLPNPPFTAAITGFVNGDSAGYAFSGLPGFTTGTTIASAPGTYTGDIMPNLGTLASAVGYGFTFVGGDLTISAAIPDYFWEPPATGNPGGCGGIFGKTSPRPSPPVVRGQTGTRPPSPSLPSGTPPVSRKPDPVNPCLRF